MAVGHAPNLGADRIHFLWQLRHNTALILQCGLIELMKSLCASKPKRGSFGGAFELRERAARVALPLEFEDFCRLDEGQPERSPNIGHAFHEMRDMRIGVQGTWRDAQSLAASGDRRIIDRLDIDRVAI